MEDLLIFIEGFNGYYAALAKKCSLPPLPNGKNVTIGETVAARVRYTNAERSVMVLVHENKDEDFLMRKLGFQRLMKFDFTGVEATTVVIAVPS